MTQPFPVALECLGQSQLLLRSERLLASAADLTVVHRPPCRKQALIRSILFFDQEIKAFLDAHAARLKQI